MEENKYDKLIKLQQLKENGTLTEKEFEIEKAKILDGNNNLENNNTENKKAEKNYTKAAPLNAGTKLLIIIKFFFGGFILGCVIPMTGGNFLISGAGFGVGVALFALFAMLIGKPIEGKCPYCGAGVYSSNKDGFDCPKCNRRIIVKNKDEFHTIN